MYTLRDQIDTMAALMAFSLAAMTLGMAAGVVPSVEAMLVSMVMGMSMAVVTTTAIVVARRRWSAVPVG